jgi:very-short-patch-repair endonuclease
MKRLIPIARRLRREKTEAEARLWFHLRNRKLAGAKFRFQGPCCDHIADFLCDKAKLVVELDGDHHGSILASDVERTAIMEAGGFIVLRFWNVGVLKNTEGVLIEIERMLAIALGRL